MNWVDRHWAEQEVEVLVLETNAIGQPDGYAWYLGTIELIYQVASGAWGIDVDVPGRGTVGVAGERHIRPLTPVFEGDPNDKEAVEAWLMTG